MSNPETQALDQLVRQWIGLWSVPLDWALFDELHDDGFEDCAAVGRPSDKHGFAQGVKALAEAFPDLQARVEDLVIDAAAWKVAVRWSASGTNRLRYLGIGPTNRRTEIRGIEIIEVRNGKVTRRWGEWDISGHRQGD